ncbi:hypothetical protein QP157_21565 [Sphingomonas sp. LR61]|uniref:hypothetical protein n=1 Tax=Sphingomonas sp. LR61 TaxID=3050234 RepID=UPI002FE22736
MSKLDDAKTTLSAALNGMDGLLLATANIITIGAIVLGDCLLLTWVIARDPAAPPPSRAATPRPSISKWKTCTGSPAAFALATADNRRYVRYVCGQRLGLSYRCPRAGTSRSRISMSPGSGLRASDGGKPPPGHAATTVEGCSKSPLPVKACEEG